jgi:hypothetical protein
MQQCFQWQALSTEQLRVKYFDVHMSVQKAEPLEAVIRSLRSCLKALSAAARQVVWCSLSGVSLGW